MRKLHISHGTATSLSLSLVVFFFFAVVVVYFLPHTPPRLFSFSLLFISGFFLSFPPLFFPSPPQPHSLFFFFPLSLSFLLFRGGALIRIAAIYCFCISRSKAASGAWKRGKPLRVCVCGGGDFIFISLSSPPNRRFLKKKNIIIFISTVRMVGEGNLKIEARGVFLGVGWGVGKGRIDH